MTDTTRRLFLQSTASLVAAGGIATTLQAAEDKPTTGAAFDNQHFPVPLPFDAKSLTGISEKLIRSHWENNYGGAIEVQSVVGQGTTFSLYLPLPA
jgi:Fe-Mn family superoxide dismutase